MSHFTQSYAFPRLRVLDDDQKRALFSGVLELLERTGVRVDNDEGLELLHGAGAQVDEDRRVRLPSFLVEKALAEAPRRIGIYDRDGERTLVLESDRVHFASQVDSTYFFDPFTRTRRECVRKDAPLGAVLCDALPNIEMVSFSALYADVPGEVAIRVGHRDTVMNCTKPLMHGTGDLASLKAVAQVASIVTGGWEELARRPYYVHYAEPLSPLTHTDEGVAKLLFCVDHGIPVIYTPMTIAGSTAPVTGAGNLVACIAESLSGLVMAQLRKPGAPVIMGGVPTVMDWSSMMVSYGAPEMSLWSAVLTEMAHYLHIPMFSTAGCTDAVAFDEQAAAESAVSCLMAALSGATLVHDVGFTEAANSASLELIVVTNELIDMIGAIVGGIEIAPETVALDVIDRVGPGGSYLGQNHTLERFRDGWFPDLMSRSNYEDWTAEGGHSLRDRANAKVCRILQEHEPPTLPSGIVAELDALERAWWEEIRDSHG